MQSHKRTGRFRKVGESLYRYSSNKTYYAVFRSHGKLIWKSLQTDDRELANRKLKEELEKHRKTDAALRGMTIADLLDAYERRLPQFDRRTQENKKSVLRKFKATWDRGMETPVKNISSADLHLWMNKEEVMRSGKCKVALIEGGDESTARVSKCTYNQYVWFLKHLFAIAIDARAIVDSPAVALKTKTPEKPIRMTPTWQQFLTIVDDIRHQFCPIMDVNDSADLIEFMGRGGVGTAECANLKGEHIEFTAKRIALYRSKTDTGYTIPIFPQLMPLLDKLKTNGRIQIGEPVFRVRDPKKTLSAACRRLKLPHFSPRSLRRCFITRAIELGVDFKTISAWQGHQDGGVLIAKTYSHLRSEHSDNMAKKLVW